MTLETSVASLTTATTALLTAVNVQKTVLDTAATTATTQAGIATAQANASANQAANAASQANIATTQADLATTQTAAATAQVALAATQATNAASSSVTAASAQVTATAQAVISATQAISAQGFSLSSQQSKNAAEAARDAANAIGKVFASSALGVAGTTTGQSFSVLGTDLSTLIVYANTNGVAVEVTRYYTKAYIDTVADASWTALSKYLWAVVDAEGRAAIAINLAGAVEIPGFGIVSDEVNAVKAINDTSYDSASGYLWGVTDAGNRLALGLNAAGEVVIPNLVSLPGDFGAASGLMYGLIDADNKLAFGVNLQGNIISKGAELTNPAALFGAADYLLPSRNLVLWGDSLTQGNTSGVNVPYPTALAALMTDRVVANKGLSGQTSVQIACKSGARGVLLTVANNTIPASGPVNAVFNAGSLTSNSNFGTLNYTGSVFGIDGTLSVPFSGTPTFTRALAGTATLIPNKCPFLPTPDGYDFNTTVIWSGYNNKADTAIVLSDIALMIANLKPLQKRFVILTVLNARYEGVGTAGYTDAIAVNDKLLEAYPKNSIDIRKILVHAGADPTDRAADIYPASLTADGLHLNDAGYQLVANTVFSFFTSKGW